MSNEKKSRAPRRAAPSLRPGQTPREAALKSAPDADWIRRLLRPQTRLAWRHFVLSQVSASFSFAHRRISEHLIWFVVNGVGTVELEGRAVRLEGGSLLWIPPGPAHAAHIPDGSKPMYVYSQRFRVRSGSAEWTFRSGPFIRHHFLEAGPWLEELYHEYGARPVGPEWLDQEQVRSKALLVLLFTALLREARAEAIGPRERGLSGTERQRLLHFVRENLALRPDSADLAKVLELTPDYFGRIFRRTFGVSVRHWVIEQRIREAAFRLSHSSANVTHVARSLGYDDVNLFCRQFRQWMGRSATSFRRGR